MTDCGRDFAGRCLPRYHWDMKNSRIIVLAACCAMAGHAWAGAGLTSAGVDPTIGNNNTQAEPTLAQVAPVTNQQGPAGGGSSGTSAGVVVPATAAGAAAQTGGAAGQHAAGAAGDAAKSATAVVAPTPPPPPPDPSTLPVSVIRPLNKTPDSAAPTTAEPASPATSAAKARPARQPLASAPAEPVAARPTPRVVQPAPPRVDARAAGDAAATPAATADGSANGYVFYTGVGIAGIILALSFAGFMRAGSGDGGRPRA